MPLSGCSEQLYRVAGRAGGLFSSGYRERPHSHSGLWWSARNRIHHRTSPPARPGPTAHHLQSPDRFRPGDDRCHGYRGGRRRAAENWGLRGLRGLPGQRSGHLLGLLRDWGRDGLRAWEWEHPHSPGGWSFTTRGSPAVLRPGGIVGRDPRKGEVTSARWWLLILELCLQTVVWRNHCTAKVNCNNLGLSVKEFY